METFVDKKRFLGFFSYLLYGAMSESLGIQVVLVYRLTQCYIIKGDIRPGILSFVLENGPISIVTFVEDLFVSSFSNPSFSPSPLFSLSLSLSLSSVSSSLSLSLSLSSVSSSFCRFSYEGV
jgi:hypothetical protein